MLLASPVNSLILRALADGPKQQADLRRAAGSPAQTTLRAQLRKLSDAGAISRHRRNRFPGAIDHELTEAGNDLLAVIEAAERWLQGAPGGPLALDGSAAKAAIKALVEGWSTAILRVLAAKPLTLTELDGVISSLNYPSLERRLTAMRLTGQVEQIPSARRGAPYRVTTWARQGIAPLAVAARWERRHLARKCASISKLDVEGAFLLVLPLLRLPADTSGSCRLSVSIGNGHKSEHAGVLVEVEGGEMASSTTRLDGHPEAWASGSATAWLTALIDWDCEALELGGDCRLARSLIEGLCEALFGVRAKPRAL